MPVVYFAQCFGVHLRQVTLLRLQKCVGKVCDQDDPTGRACTCGCHLIDACLRNCDGMLTRLIESKTPLGIRKKKCILALLHQFAGLCATDIAYSVRLHVSSMFERHFQLSGWLAVSPGVTSAHSGVYKRKNMAK